MAQQRVTRQGMSIHQLDGLSVGKYCELWLAYRIASCEQCPLLLCQMEIRSDKRQQRWQGKPEDINPMWCFDCMLTETQGLMQIECKQL